MVGYAKMSHKNEAPTGSLCHAPDHSGSSGPWLLLLREHPMGYARPYTHIQQDLVAVRHCRSEMKGLAFDISPVTSQAAT